MCIPYKRRGRKGIGRYGGVSMREILFKAKSITTGEWVEGDLVRSYLKIGNACITDFAKGIVCGVDINTICQYTGLTDKKRNKIWENDVVGIDGTDRAIVIFSEKHSGYILQPIGDFYFDYPMLVDNVDIIDNCIGNIFDNPELLGV